MARIQVLPLPSRVVGDVVEEPFALIIDQAEDLGGLGEVQANLQAFKADCGAAGLLVVDGQLDIPQEPADRTISFRPDEGNVGLLERALQRRIRQGFADGSYTA